MLSIPTKDANPGCPIANAVALQVLERSKSGISKYGTDMTRTDLDVIQWLQHLQEELLDGAVYIERLKRELNNPVKS